MIFKERYEQKERLGKGGFGEVLKVLDKQDGKFYALKFIPKNTKENTDDLIENYKKEINMMKNIKSEYIVKLKENFYDESYEGYCIVMELCDTDLSEILKKCKPNGLPLKLINKIFIQLNDALKAMLKKDCFHRDLKPENILIKYTDKNKLNFDIRLTDFGLSTNDIKNTLIKTRTFVGTKNYCAPEIEGLHYNNKCDLWSLGVILYELYTNKYIFFSFNPKESENNRQNGIIKEIENNELINNLIKKLIKVDIDKRIEWEEYFNDDFFKNKQIIKITINVNYDNKKIKIFNGNKHINEKNIKIFVDEKEIQFNNEINSLKKGINIIKMKIDQKLINCKEMFKNCNKIVKIEFINFDTQNVTNMSEMFYNCENLEILNLNNFDTENVKDMSRMFNCCKNLINLNLNNFDTQNVTNMSGMFYNCENLKNLNLNNFNTKNVTNMSEMYSHCSGLKNINLKNFDTKNVIDMSNIFYNCKNLENLDLNNFDTKNVINMSGMFFNCYNLKNLDLNNFDTKNVTNMCGMFYWCFRLVNLKLNNFDTKNVTNMSGMFYNCESLENLELNNFNTENVTNMSRMFYNCKKLKKLNLNNFNTKNVTNSSDMFAGCNFIFNPY
jgi:surface protein